MCFDAIGSLGDGSRWAVVMTVVVVACMKGGGGVRVGGSGCLQMVRWCEHVARNRRLTQHYRITEACATPSHDVAPLVFHVTSGASISPD